MFADGAVRALLTAVSEVEVSQLFPVEALVSANIGEIEDGEGEVRKAADVYFVGGEPCSGVDGVVHALSTCGNCSSQSVCCSLTTMASIRAIV